MGGYVMFGMTLAFMIFVTWFAFKKRPDERK